MRGLLDWLTHNWTLKLAALALAIVLWSLVKSEELTRVTIPDIPVEVLLRDPGWDLAGQPSPSTVNVDFTGPVREVVRLAVERPRVVIPVDQVTDSVEVLVLRTAWVQLYGSLTRTRAEDIRPSTVRLVFDPVSTRLVPLALPTRGTLPPGIALTGPVRIQPPSVRVSGPKRRLETLDSIELPPLDLTHVTGPTTLRVGVDTAGLGLLVAPTTVRLFVPAGPAPDTAGAAPDTAASTRPTTHGG